MVFWRLKRAPLWGRLEKMKLSILILSATQIWFGGEWGAVRLRSGSARILLPSYGFAQSMGFTVGRPDPSLWTRTGRGYILIRPRSVPANRYAFRYRVSVRFELYLNTAFTTETGWGVVSAPAVLISPPRQSSRASVPRQRKSSPNTGAILLRLGDEFFRDGEFEKALWSYRLSEEKGESAGAFGQVHSLVAVGRFSEAAGILRPALRRDPGWLGLDFRLSSLTTKSQLLSEKIRTLEIQMSKTRSDNLRLLLGYCLYFNGSKSKAKLFLQKIDSDPEAKLILQRLEGLRVFPTWGW